VRGGDERATALSIGRYPVSPHVRHCTDDPGPRQHHAPVRVLPHIKKLDDALGDFLVRVTCPCGASRHIEPEALARIAGRSATLAKFAARPRCSQCGKKVAEVVAVTRPRPKRWRRSWREHVVRMPQPQRERGSQPYRQAHTVCYLISHPPFAAYRSRPR
jgi:hypothetical protein